MRDDDSGMLQARLEQFVKHQLPQMLAIKEKTDAGKPLSDVDLEIMKRAIEQGQDSNATAGFVNKYPEYADLVAKTVDLYAEIMEKATLNESNASGDD